MGMDLVSISNNKEFRANVWSWRPIWNLVRVEVGLTDDEYYAGSCNDGFEITEEKAKEIHDKLSELDLPKTIKEYHYYLDTLPLEDCNICDGNGKRNDDNVKGDCNACNNEYTREEGIPLGKQKNWQTSYRMHQEHIEEFIDFCDKSKGFKIF